MPKYQTQDTVQNNTLGFVNMPVRFFVWDYDDSEEGDLTECDEATFIEADGAIEYERYTMFRNGCNQICLTKNPFI